MSNFEILTGPSGATELVLPIRFLKAGDKYMCSTIESIHQRWVGGNFIITWISRDGSKNTTVASKENKYQKNYLQLA